GVIEPGADVGDPTLSGFPRDSSRLAVEPAIALSVSFENFGVAFGAQELGPEFAFSRAELSFYWNRVGQCVILLDAASQQICQRSGLTLRLQTIVLILHGGALAQDQVSALAHVFDEVFRGGIGENVESWRDYQFVLIEWS